MGRQSDFSGDGLDPTPNEELAIPFDGGLVTVDPATGRLYAFNAAAATIWTLLQAGFSDSEAATFLQRRFQLCERDAHSHVQHVAKQIAASLRPERSTGERSPARRQQVVTRTFRIKEISFSIATDGPEVSSHVFGVLRPYMHSAEPASCRLQALATATGSFDLYVNEKKQLEDADGPATIGALFQAMLEATSDNRDWMALIHGASVAVDRVGLLLAGISGSGKSTLAAYLSKRGYKYFSDDLIALNAHGRIVPWPVSHGLKRGSWQVLENAFPVLKELGADCIHAREVKFVAPDDRAWTYEPVDAHVLVFPRFRPEAATTLTAISPLSALQRLIADRIWFGFPIDPQRVRSFLAKLQSIHCFALDFSTLEAAESELARVVS